MCFTIFLSSSGCSTGNLKASWVIDRFKLFWSVFWRDQHFWSTIQVIDLNMICNCGWNSSYSGCFLRIVIPMEFPFTFFCEKRLIISSRRKWPQFSAMLLSFLSSDWVKIRLLLFTWWQEAEKYLHTLVWNVMQM